MCIYEVNIIYFNKFSKDSCQVIEKIKKIWILKLMPWMTWNNLGWLQNWDFIRIYTNLKSLNSESKVIDLLEKSLYIKYLRKLSVSNNQMIFESSIDDSQYHIF
jgi:hypothetical protein